MRIFAKNFRGFSEIDFDVSHPTFLVGDNSSGKTSILHLVEYVFRTSLVQAPNLNSNHLHDWDGFTSPYFDHADVIIGFENDEEPDEEGEVGKLVRIQTIQRVKDEFGEPTNFVSRFTASDGVHAVTIAIFNQKIHAASYNGASLAGFSGVLDFHNCDDLEFSPVAEAEEFHANHPYVVVRAMSLLHSMTEESEDVQFEFFGTLQGKKFLPSLFLGPLRSGPERYYDQEISESVDGQRTLANWHKLSKHEKRKYWVPIKRFANDSGLFSRFEVDTISEKFARAPLHVRIIREEKEFSLSEVGVGVSQSVPVLLQLIWGALTERIVLVQQPELHLHPVAQAAMGDYFFEMNEKGCGFIAETHSDYLIDRYRYRVRKSSSEQGACIIYCENSRIGNTAYKLDIEEDGTIANAPDSYREFFINELSKQVF
ncbi:AAA ATPase-like protein [Maritalea mobilis]|uniref:AAA ATPase-like protein n=1 Tax=Maritalea mobilis TaxID=483324 RepID=A0A4R6VJ53_9HYPH|nr:AAA family ATPase [Maritalea mobilis]TDQ63629.1 AAA ATPase-like protein [Maritalea mobilis]